MNPRRGTVNCTEACLNTPPCLNQFLTFGAYNDNVIRATRIALTQPLPLQPDSTVSSVTTPTTSEPLSTTQLPTTQFSLANSANSAELVAMLESDIKNQVCTSCTCASYD